MRATRAGHALRRLAIAALVAMVVAAALLVASPALREHVVEGIERAGELAGVHIRTPNLEERLASAPDAVATYDAAVAPLLRASQSAAALEALRDALDAARRGELIKARELDDPLARQLATWLALRQSSGNAGFEELDRFIAANPGWPTGRLADLAEARLLTAAPPAEAVMRHFAAAPPRSLAGHVILARAALEAGDRELALTHARRALLDPALGAQLEASLLDAFGGLLAPADLALRVDIHLMEAARSRASRKRHTAAAGRLIALLPEDSRAPFNARIARLEGAKDAEGLVAALGDEARATPGFAFEEALRLRRAEKKPEAWRVLAAAVATGAPLANGERWWRELRINAFEALQAGDIATAYALADVEVELPIESKLDQHVTAGWIALRLLADPSRAEPHFRALGAAANGPASRSESAYWLARLHEARGEGEPALEQARRAAREFSTFYGQMALERLSPQERRANLPLREALTRSAVDRFRASEPVRAVALASAAGRADVARLLLTDIRGASEDGPELALLAHLATRLGDIQMGVRIAKKGLFHGHKVVYWAYPVDRLPDYEPLRAPPEEAILYAIARQESEFNTEIESTAGAKGLLQVMPATARHVCRQHAIACPIDQLRSDPAFNLRLASAYLSELIEGFDGSYILAIAGYNAGPGRARGWIRENGDPRKAGIDPIDWIERISYLETREYVKKVMANLQIYRALLGDPGRDGRIADDLARARSAS
ncbi:MAG: transglycosylase SLT domain-containing protein [Rhizobiales bacterium]|nr:transglycosylase SLT domain-containing protein [Hyphomicrobiales bacterium]